MITRLLAPPAVGVRGSVGLLIVRVVVGAAFMFFGWGKIQHPFSWMGPDSWAPGFLQFLAALSEFGGGAALIVGLLVPLASLGLACTMTVAAFTHISKGDPFVGMKGSWQPAAVFLSISLLLLLLGPGKLSLDALLFRRKPA
jgi:putative oxidoreductase